MKLARTLKLTLFAALLAASLTAAAQEAAGTFTLKQDTRWGTVAVPAGEYSVSVSYTSRVATLRPIQPAGTAKFVLPVAWDYAATCKSGALNLTSREGKWIASSLCLPETGVVLYFPTPATSAPTVLAKAATGSANAGSR